MCSYLLHRIVLFFWFFTKIILFCFLSIASSPHKRLPSSHVLSRYALMEAIGIYVVYLGANLLRLKIASLISIDHEESFGCCLGNKDKAKDAIFDSYIRHTNNFAATLENDEPNTIMASIVNNISNVSFSPFVILNEIGNLHSRVLVKSTSTEKSARMIVRESIKINGASSLDRKRAIIVSYDDGRKKDARNVIDRLKPLWDDGYGTRSVKDYVDTAMDLIRIDGGPPRWFCPVACGAPIKDSPVLLYLPGMDGTGAGLAVHEKALGKLFHVQCLHIPASDRTPLEGLIQIVEEIVMIEHTRSPDKPIYLLGDCFGGNLALSVAARNPTIDLMLILANPGLGFKDILRWNLSISATSYERLPAPPLMSLLTDLPMSPHLSKLLLIKDQNMNLVCFIYFSIYLNLGHKILPKDTFTWRLKLVESAASYANSRLHAITAQVLVLASGKDNFMPSKNEARRLLRLLKHCNVRVFEGNGHTILLENGVNLLSAIKTTQMYRHFSKFDIFKDFLPMSMTEFKDSPIENIIQCRWYRLYIGTAVFSTMEDGKIVRGLAGIPDKGPVLVVGNHMLWGFDAFSVILEFLRERKITLHGLSHPESYQYRVEHELVMIPYTDLLKIIGAIPVSARNLFRLLSGNSHALLYPGGARESLHRKGEACKLFWPDKQEFVRMAVKLGATIIPFGAVGEDDLSELIIDYNDMKKIPLLDQLMNDYNQGRINLREGMGGEIAKQQLHTPIFLPKLPGRIYFLFCKPIQTKGKEHMSDDKDFLHELYIQIKCDVEKNIAYLLTKRENDPYRGIVERLMWLIKYDDPEKLKVFWDDGFGTQTIDDAIEIAMELSKSDGGPPRWFCPIACGKPIKDSPVLLYLPGNWCFLYGYENFTNSTVFMHLCLSSSNNNTQGLIQLVEETVKIEHTLSPNKPIYLLGESFGGALALAVAARNPTIDLILILANPATSFERSPLRSFPYIVNDWPEEHYGMLFYIMSPIVGRSRYNRFATLKCAQLFNNCTLLDSNLGNNVYMYICKAMHKILPKDTLAWRLKLVESAAAYANSRLHVVTCQVLVLASGKDNILPSKDEARRLYRRLKHCDVRVFEENGHTILLESGVNVLSAIKTTYMYRRFSKHDILKDFLPASMTEFKSSLVDAWWYRLYIDAVMYSTMEDGKIVRGLGGIPDEGPVLIVGNHMLMAFDVFPIVSEFLREKKLSLHGLTHPEFFHVNLEHEYHMVPLTDLLKLGGAIPVTGKNLFKLLANKSHVLLYPGGAREALHRKATGKLFWPDKQEFVRMAVRFGATIIPYGGVGEDDILDLIVDYNDMKRNPILNHMVNIANQGKTNVREGMRGEVAKQQLHVPFFLPKLPGRLYFKFGKPIRTKGKENMIDDDDYLQRLYMQIKSNVEKSIAYLLEKRDNDPYRGAFQRFVWRMKHGSLDQIASFEP
ncbi:hypothetical protein R6Q57_006740 [Mikania cordata]